MPSIQAKYKKILRDKIDSETVRQKALAEIYKKKVREIKPTACLALHDSQYMIILERDFESSVKISLTYLPSNQIWNAWKAAYEKLKEDIFNNLQA